MKPLNQTHTVRVIGTRHGGRHVISFNVYAASIDDAMKKGEQKAESYEKEDRWFKWSTLTASRIAR